MLRLFRIENGLIKEVEFEPSDLSEQLQHADWIDAHEPDDDERALLQLLLHTDLPESEEVEEI